MNKKGFTLTELLAVIIVLAILIAIAIPSYFAVSNNAKKTLRDEKLELIRVKAIQYAEDNNLAATTISVAKLIDEGYLAQDSKSEEAFQKMVNPYPDGNNDNYLDCYLADVTREDGEYKAKVNKSNDCTNADVDIDSSKLNVEVYAYDSVNKRIIKHLGSNKNVDWTKNDVLLFASPNNIGTIESVSWGSGSSSITKTGVIENTIGETSTPNEDAANVYVVSAALIINSTYSASVKTEEGIYNREVNVKIDKEKPTATIDTNSEWLNDLRKVVIIASDGNGSGIRGYYVATNRSDVPTEDSEFNSNNVFELSNGIYYAYAIDNVGNISELGNSSTITVDNITTGGDLECVSNVDSLPTVYVNYDVTLSYGCKSSTVGCKTQTKTKTYPETKSETFRWTIEDNLGNTKQCSVPINIKIDKVPPQCDRTNFTSWTTQNRTITWGCKDTGGSNCTVVQVGEKLINYSTKTYKVAKYVIKDNAGNQTTCEATDVNVLINKEKPKISPKKNPLSMGSQDYTFTSNINVDYGVSGGKTVCDPAKTKKTGIYNVTCTATTDAGLSASTTFKVQHSYEGTQYEHKYDCNCGWEECTECRNDSGSNGCWGMDYNGGSCTHCVSLGPCYKCKSKCKETWYDCGNKGGKHSDGTIKGPEKMCYY